MIKIFSESNSIVNKFVSELRDVNIQNDSLRFRRNLERIGEVIAYEISKELEYEKKKIQTPLGNIESYVLKENIVIGGILRAGLPIHQGVLNYFDKAQNAFIGSYRRYHKDNTFDIKSGYLSAPSVENKYLILTDAMLASGASMVLAYNDLTRDTQPKFTHIVTVLAAKEGVEYLKNHLLGQKYKLWIAAIDDELTAKSYIVPGLGDAGDLAFGNKE